MIMTERAKSLNSNRIKLLWFLVPILGIIELVAQAAIDHSVPPIEDWDAAAEAIRSGHRKDDLVVIAPWWATHARMSLADFMPMEDQARADASVYRRLWEVSIRGAEAPEADGLDSDFEEHFGKVRVRRFNLGTPASVRYSFLHHLDEADVSTVNASGAASKCSFSTSRWLWQCAKARWAWTGPVVIDDEEHRPRQGIWAHPIRGKRIRFLYSGIPAGKMLYGYTGIRYFAARSGDGDPVHLDIFVNGKRLLEVIHNDPDGWKHFELPLNASGESVDVAFEVYSKGTGNRHFVFTADVRD